MDLSRRSAFVAALGLLLVACTPVASPEAAAMTEADALAGGRRAVAALYAGKTQELWDRFDEGMRGVVGDKTKLDAFVRGVVERHGAEEAVVEETVKRKPEAIVYVRIVRFAKDSALTRIAFGLAGERIVGMVVQPAEPEKPVPTTKLDYQTRAKLRLPFDGAWSVFWGGRTFEQNHHVVVRDQRFAYDIVIEEGGTTHRGEGRKNDDYLCYGRPILSPAAGRVSSVVDGVPENVPGKMDSTHPAGNYVIVDHGQGEFSILAHLVPGSIAVRSGDEVTSGQLLGRCGNSGNSSEPHLHYQLQDGPRFGDADGLPAQFVNYATDGKPTPRGEPVRGQRIENLSAEGSPRSPRPGSP